MHEDMMHIKRNGEVALYLSCQNDAYIRFHFDLKLLNRVQDSFRGEKQHTTEKT